MKTLPALTRQLLAACLLLTFIGCSAEPDTRVIPPSDNRPDTSEPEDVGADADVDSDAEGDVDSDTDVDENDVCDAESDEELCELSEYTCGALTVTDSCGEERVIESCGPECGELQTCGGGGVEGQCGCSAAESDAQLCQLNSYSCGPLTAVDSCGEERTIESCGPECGDPQTCGGGGIEGQCGCTPDLTDEEHCANNAAECGELTIVDSCGEERVIDCGAEDQVCTLFDTCGGGGEENLCGCTPITCEEAQVMCGPIDDGCGGTAECDA